MTFAVYIISSGIFLLGFIIGRISRMALTPPAEPWDPPKRSPLVWDDELDADVLLGSSSEFLVRENTLNWEISFPGESHASKNTNDYPQISRTKPTSPGRFIAALGVCPGCGIIYNAKTRTLTVPSGVERPPSRSFLMPSALVIK